MTKLHNRLFDHCVGLLKHDKANVAVIFALASLPIVGAVGAAVDFSSGNRVRANLQAALDSAVLAAAIDASPGWQAIAHKAFNANVNAKLPGTAVGEPSFSESDGVYYGVITASAPTSFVKLIGVKSMPIQAKSAATTA